MVHPARRRDLTRSCVRASIGLALVACSKSDGPKAKPQPQTYVAPAATPVNRDFASLRYFDVAPDAASIELSKVHLTQLSTHTPLAIDLESFDVRPRTAFGTLAHKSLSMLSEKVAQVADLNVVIPLVPRSKPPPAQSRRR